MIEPTVIGNATLYNADCRDILPTLAAGSVDMVLTDPPYEGEAHTSMRRTRAVIEGRQKQAAMPFAPMTEELRAMSISESCRLSRGWVLMFCQAEAVGKYQECFGSRWRRPMIWVKPDSLPQFSGDRPAMGYESMALAWAGEGKSKWNGGGKRGVFTYNSTRYVHEHPAQKPIDLVTELVYLFSNEGNTILDSFMGSGTVGVVCALMKRPFIGIEIDPVFFDIACRRIERAQIQERLPL